MAEGDQGAAFQASIPTEYQGHAAVKDYKDMGSFVKSHIELQGKLGQAPIDRIDFKDSGTRGKILEKLRPAAATEYGLSDSAFATRAHTLGLTVEQAKAAAEYADSRTATLATQRATERAASIESAKQKRESALRGEWGAKYDAENALFEKALNHNDFIPKDLRDLLTESGAIHHPALVKALNRFGHQMEEGSFTMGGSGGGGAQAGDRQAAVDALNKFTNENSKLVFSQRDMDPQVAAAKARRLELLGNVSKFAAPETKTIVR